MSVLIYTENWDGKFKKSTHELVSYANEIAKLSGSEVTAVTIGEVDETELKELGKYGAKKVLVVKDAQLKDFSAQAYAAVISEAAKNAGAKHIVIANNYSGRALAPRIAVKLDAGLVAGVVQLPSTLAPFTVRKKAYSGKAFADVVLNSDVSIVTLNQNTFKIIESPVEISIEDFSAAIPEGAYNAKPIEVTKSSDKLSVTDAEILVSGGRGLKGPENWGMLEEMAEILGAATCCSRPVSDLEWRPHSEHVGQTGKVVAPNLYIAVGISGAIQHLAGVNSSKVMVCINTDPEAPFFEAADYGIVGDVQKVLPQLVEAAKAFKANS